MAKRSKTDTGFIVGKFGRDWHVQHVCGLVTIDTWAGFKTKAAAESFARQCEQIQGEAVTLEMVH